MTQPILDTGLVALLDPVTRRIPDDLAPPSVLTNATAAAASAAAAAASVNQAAAFAAQAGTTTATIAAASAAAASQTAAATSAAAAAASASAAAASAVSAAAGGGTASTQQITDAINGLAVVARTGSYTDLTNQPPIAAIQQALASTVSSQALAATVATLVPTSAINALNGVLGLDATAHMGPNFLPTQVPLFIGDGSATVPIRPAYNGRVIFDCTTAPPLTGSLAGGTAAAVDGVDRWYT